MSAIIKSEMISRRNALSLMGLAAAFGLAAAPTVLTVSDAEAQTAAAPTATAPTARHGAASGAAHGAHRAASGAAHSDAQSDVRCGAQVQLPEQVPLPAQLSNSTGSAKSLIEPATQPPPELNRRTPSASRIATTP